MDIGQDRPGKLSEEASTVFDKNRCLALRFRLFSICRIAQSRPGKFLPKRVKQRKEEGNPQRARSQRIEINKQAQLGSKRRR